MRILVEFKLGFFNFNDQQVTHFFLDSGMMHIKCASPCQVRVQLRSL